MEYNTIQRNVIGDDFYDNNTYQMLLTKMNDDDKNYIMSNNFDIMEFIFSRWRTTICSFMPDYYNEYMTVPIEYRNRWFQKYLNLPSHDMNEMPYTLLPL